MNQKDYFEYHHVIICYADNIRNKSNCYGHVSAHRITLVYLFWNVGYRRNTY